MPWLVPLKLTPLPTTAPTSSELVMEPVEVPLFAFPVASLMALLPPLGSSFKCHAPAKLLVVAKTFDELELSAELLFPQNIWMYCASLYPLIMSTNTQISATSFTLSHR